MKPARRRWLLLGAVAFGAAAGFCISLWSWPQDESGSASAGGAGGAQALFFSDPAFSPGASAADLKRAAEQAAEELAEAFPQSPETQAVLAKAKTNVPGGIAAVRQMAIETHREAGRCYLQQGQTEKAVEMLRKAAALGPQDVRSRTELLAIYVKTGRDREALEVCRQLSRLEPERGDHWLKLALLCASLDDLEGAKNAIRRAREIDPANAQYREVERLLEEG